MTVRDIFTLPFQVVLLIISAVIIFCLVYFGSYPKSQDRVSSFGKVIEKAFSPGTQKMACDIIISAIIYLFIAIYAFL